MIRFFSNVAWKFAHFMKRTFMPYYVNFDRVCDIEVDGINGNDAPDFSDAFIINAYYKTVFGFRKATEEELDTINDNSGFVYTAIENAIY